MAEGLWWSRILGALQRHTRTDLGGVAALALPPAGTPDEAERRFDETAQAELLLASPGLPTLPQQLAIDALLTQAGVGAPLSAADLCLVGRVAQANGKLRQAATLWPNAVNLLRQRCEDAPDVTLLADIFGQSLAEDATILDTASGDLARLRHEVVVLAAKLRQRIEQLVRQTDAAGLLQDDYFTLRDDRYVLPVRSTEKRTLSGIIHGSSQTGQTVYIEPQELVEANNRLAMAYDAVRREERRILAELSALCAESAEALRAAVAMLAHFDLTLALARLARQLQAHRPQFCVDRIALPRLRHPVLVLEGAATVANDVEMVGPAMRWLVVSGPNGGGKTVLLTAIGLAAEMARHGLLVAAGADASLPFFAGVAAVVGDAQNLTLGLSTFEGHLRAVQAVLAAAQRQLPALILLDELAAGTEPTAGSALATALLEHAAATLPHAWGVVTTHFEACKLLALRDKTFANAALCRDEATGAPAYRMAFGQVGSSDPLALAQRLGLPAAVTDRAGQLMGSMGHGVAAALQELDSERKATAQEANELRNERLQLEAERMRAKSQRESEQLTVNARVAELAQAAVFELRQWCDEIAAARAALVDADRLALQQAGRTAAEHVQQAQAVAHAARPTKHAMAERSPVAFAELRPGLPLWHVRLQQAVAVVEVAAHQKRCKVAAGAMQLWAEVSELRHPLATDQHAAQRHLAPRPPSLGPSRPVRDELAVPQSLTEASALLRTAEATVDVRGMRADEAIAAVERHLDQALLTGAVGACIVHGGGTGALRDAIRTQLRRHRGVAQFRAGDRHEGGDGATLVWLRQ